MLNGAAATEPSDTTAARLNAHLEEPVESLSDQRPAHGAPGQRQAALLVPRQAPAEAPQLPGERQQQERGQD